MVAVGHLLGYAAGTIDLLKVFGTTLGDSQFKQMTAIAAMALIFSVCVTSYAVKERILISARYALLSCSNGICSLAAETRMSSQVLLR